MARDEDGLSTAGEGAASLAGFRAYGHSKDHRSDVPQVVVGMAVTREGILVRVWSWPGNSADVSLCMSSHGPSALEITLAAGEREQL